MDLIELESGIGKIVAAAASELASLRTNRPTAKLVEDIKVVVYNEPMTIKQLGSISIVPPREIDISIWDASTTSVIAEAISAALNLNAVVSGTLIRVILPALTDERRRDIGKVASRIAEDARIKIRSFRDGANKKIESDTAAGRVAEDQKFKLKEQVQKIIDAGNVKIGDTLDLKLKEIQE